MRTEQDFHSLWKQEQEAFETLRKEQPELFIASKKTSEAILDRIGIGKVMHTSGKGFLKYVPFDFIVEEVTTDGAVLSVTAPLVSTDVIEEHPGQGTVYATLIKTGISTIEAVERLAVALRCDKQQFSYAGIKDAVAITAQRIGIRGVALSRLRQLEIPQILLTDFTVGKGVVTPGNLKGNKFTIAVRIAHDFNQKLFEEKISHIRQRGLVNYYGPQRFGSPRYQSHMLGRHILRNDFEGLVKAVLIGESPFEWPLIAKIRTKAARIYGNWQEMRAVFLHLPYTFRQEIGILENIIRWDGKGDQWHFAVSSIPEQIDFWVKSYASYLANQVLFRAAKTDEVLPKKIPLLLNIKEEEEIEKWYGSFLREDATERFRAVMQRLPQVRRGQNSYLETIVVPTEISYIALRDAVILSFYLPKGAYATTFIYELFDIEMGSDIPSWVSTRYIDSKKELGKGSFDAIYDWVSAAAVNPLEK